MRFVKYCAGLGGAWLIASALGALAALGPARWARGDWTPGTMVAGVATGGTVAALAWLGLRASRRRWLRVVTFAVAFPLVAIAAMPVGIATWATHPAHADLTAARPDNAVDVSIPIAGGDVLAAWYLPSRNGAAVVLSHGGGSTRDATVGHAHVLASAGYGVLMIDARGHGESSGSAMDLGWWGEEDISAALDVLAAMPDVDPKRLGLVGLSMGAEESIGDAGVDPRVAAVIAEGATARTAQDKDGWLPGGLPGFVQRRMDTERDVILGWLSDAPKPATLRAAAQASEADFLLITASTVPGEAEAAAWIAEGNDRVVVWTIPGAGHTRGLTAMPDEWSRRVIEFLGDALAT